MSTRPTWSDVPHRMHGNDDVWIGNSHHDAHDETRECAVLGCAEKTPDGVPWVPDAEDDS